MGRFLDFFLWVSGLKKDREVKIEIPSDFKYPNDESTLVPHLPTVCWVNHSTFLLQLNGACFLTDPIWSKRCSPVQFLGPKRLHLPPIQMRVLPNIDFVLISHNHYDHLDKGTVKKLHKLFPKIMWIVPTGVKSWFEKVLPGATVRELKWWENYQASKFTFTAVPAQHFSGRKFSDYNKSAWMGCVVRGEGKCFYFAGDSGYNNSHFVEIGTRCSPIDLSLIPIGAYLPRNFMAPVHVDPEESVKIHQEVGSKLSIAGHFNTFKLSSELRNQPPYDLFLALKRAGISPSKFRVLNPGQKINW